MTDVILVNLRNSALRDSKLGLGHLAAARERVGLRVAWRDASALEIGVEEGTIRVARSGAVWVGISVTSIDLQVARDLVRAIRRRAPCAQILAGGPHVSAEPGIVATLGVPMGSWRGGARLRRALRWVAGGGRGGGARHPGSREQRRRRTGEPLRAPGGPGRHSGAGPPTAP